MSRHAVCPGFAGFPCGHIGNIVALREPSLATKRRYGPSEVATAQTREKTLEGQQAAAARGNHGGRSKVLDEDDVLFARALRDKGTPMPGTAKTRGNGSKDVARLVARHPRKRPGRFRHPRGSCGVAAWPHVVSVRVGSLPSTRPYSSRALDETGGRARERVARPPVCRGTRAVRTVVRGTGCDLPRAGPHGSRASAGCHRPHAPD